MKNTTSENLSNNFKDCVDISHPNVAFTIPIYLSAYLLFLSSVLFSLFLISDRLWDETFCQLIVMEVIGWKIATTIWEVFHPIFSMSGRYLHTWSRYSMMIAYSFAKKDK